MVVEASIPPGRLLRLMIKAGNGDVDALREIKTWRDKHPGEASHYAKRSSRMRLVFNRLDKAF